MGANAHDVPAGRLDAPDDGALGALGPLFEAMPGLCVALAPDAPRFTVVAATGAYCRAARTPCESILGRGLFETFGDVRATEADLRASFADALRTRAPHRAAPQRLDVVGGDGRPERRIWRPLTVPVCGADGSVRWLLLQLDDVTDAVARDAAVEAAEHRAARLLERMADAHVVLDADFRVLDLNPAAERLLGFDKAGVLGKTHWEAWPASVGTEVERRYREIVAERTDAHFTHHYVDAPHDLHLEIDAYPTDEGGVAVFARDVSARVRAEREMRESEARYRMLAELSPDATWVYQDGRIVYANAAAARAMGARGPEELLGRSPLDVAEPAYHDVIRERTHRALEGDGENPLMTMRWRRLDGSAVDVETAAGKVLWQGRPAVQVVFRDISDRTHAVAARDRLLAELEAERAWLRAIVVQTPAPLALLVGPEHRFTLVSNAYRRISGGGRDVTGLTPAEAFPELAGSGIYELFDRVYETGEAWDGPETLVRYDRDGTGVQDTWFNLRFEPVRDASGAVTAILNFAVDVTEQVTARREAERLLAGSERARADAEAARARSEAVLGSIADAFYLLDREWRFTYVNDAAEPLLQTTREALIGRTLWDAFPGVAGSVFEGPYREAMATGRPTSAEAFFAPLGTWFDVHSYPWAGGLMVHFRDIGARKAAEAEREQLLRALALERARLEEVFRVAPSFIVAFRGSNQTYEWVNEAYYQLVGHRAIIGKPLLEAIPEIRGQGFDVLIERVRQTGEPWVGRETPVQLQRTPGGPLETRYLDMVFQALAEADGERSGVVVHGSDITAQVLARREVERLLGVSEQARADAEAARAEAEAANRAKSEFLAVMSHELRTPLNAIDGYAELMELGIRGPLTSEQREDLARIRRSQRHLLGLINGVLNYSRVEAGAVRYDLEDVPLREALATCEALTAPQRRAKRLTFHFDGCDSALRVRADAEKLQQIVLNLLTNALKFTEPGGRVELACRAEGDTIAVTVTDTGRGIAPEHLERVFEPFVQVDATRTRTQDGVGLGLAISRDLARGMGGDLTAESTLGEGSTFTLTLPCA